MTSSAKKPAPVPASTPPVRLARQAAPLPAYVSAETSFSQADAFRGDASELIRKMRAGTPARIIPDMAARLGLSQDRLFDTLKLPKSTMKARISEDALLSSAEQDRIYRAEKVWARAFGVLEDEHSARRWIVQENRSLGGEAPLSLLDTEAGYELVLDTLGRIEYGIVS